MAETKTTKKITKTTNTSPKATIAKKIVTPTNSEDISPRSVKVKRSYIIIIIVIALLVAAAFLNRSLFVAATVNGQPIGRLSVIKELEKQGGKQTLDAIITKTLIQQEGKKRNITVSQSDIDAEMKKIDANLAKQGQKLDQVLTLQGMTKDQLIEQIKLQKMIEKMVGNTAVSDKEIDDYITANKDSLPQGQDEQTARASVKDRLAQQKLNDSAQKFLDDLKKNAKIDYYVKY